MTAEHLWPLWLIDHADAHREGIRWHGAPKRIHPRNATLPLCDECNHRLGAELEGPVSRIFPQLEAGEGISDGEAELLVRWMWKYEGLASSYAFAGNSDWRYSDRWTLIERVLGDEAIRQIRGDILLAIGITNRNDPDHTDWPMGIDSEISESNAIFVSGVFGKTALMVSLAMFAELINPWFGTYNLKPERDDGSGTCFLPPVAFPYSADAIYVTKKNSTELLNAHEEYTRLKQREERIYLARPRVIIPG